MDKKDLNKFAKTLTNTEIKKIEDRRQYLAKAVEDLVLKKLAVFAELTFGQFIKARTLCNEHMHSILTNQRWMQQNKVDLTKNKTEQIYSQGPLAGKRKAMEDLKVENIKLGPTLPAFISENVLNVLVDKFKIAPIGDVDADLKEMLG